MAVTTHMPRYLEFRTRARDLLKDDPEHSIWFQLVELFWRDAAFRTFNEARRSASAGKPNAAVAPLLANFLDEAYVAGEISAIGRLTDPPAIDPSRGVVSLPTVLQLIRKHRHLLTRQAFVTFDGAPYDPAPSAAAARASRVGGVQWVAREPWDDAEERHDLFDRLSRKAPDRRRPTDLVHREVLAACEDRLGAPAIRRLRTYRNKIISHAADSTSRGALGSLGMTMADVDEAHRAVLEVAETLSTIALGEILVGGPVAVPQYDVLDNLDRPFVAAAELDQLQRFWSDFTAEREAWSSGAVRAVLGR